MTINFFNSVLDIGWRDATRGVRHLNLLFPQRRFLRGRIRKYRKGEITVQWTSIPLGVPFPCLLPLSLVSRYVYRPSSSLICIPQIYWYMPRPDKSTLFGRFIPRVKGRRETGFSRCARRKDYIAFPLNERRLFTRSLKRVFEEIAQNVRGLLKAQNVLCDLQIRQNNITRIHRRIRSNVCYNFCKGISCFYVGRCVPSLHRIQYGTYTRAYYTLPWMCAIKRRLPSHPRLMVILLGEIEGFSFPAKKSVDGLPLPPSPILECAILPGSFSDPPTSRKRRRRPRELSVSPTDFSIKLPETTGRSAVGSTTITIDWRTLAFIAYVLGEGRGGGVDVCEGK